jgi:hypothetical protein
VVALQKSPEVSGTETAPADPIMKLADEDTGRRSRKNGERRESQPPPAE